MRAIVFGATSRIAEEVLRLWAARGDELFLVARNAERLAAVAADLRVRGAAAVRTAVADLDDLARHRALFDEAGGFDAVLIAHGVLSGEPQAILHTNLNSAASLLGIAAERAQAGACLAALSSVAGDRGRAVNGAYGASKAGLDAFLSALRQKLYEKNIKVVTLKPGFVETPMTAQMPKSALFAKPAAVARGIVRAIDRGAPVVYLPWFWRWVMLAVRSIPERLFRRLKF